MSTRPSLGKPLDQLIGHKGTPETNSLCTNIRVEGSIRVSFFYAKKRFWAEREYLARGENLFPVQPAEVVLDDWARWGHNPMQSGGAALRLSACCSVARTPKRLLNPHCPPPKKGGSMSDLLNMIQSDEGQDIAEYAVMLAVILVLVVGTIRLIGSNANNVFSNTASSIQ